MSATWREFVAVTSMDGFTASNENKKVWAFAYEGEEITPEVLAALEPISIETLGLDGKYRSIVKVNKRKQGNQFLSAIHKWNNASPKKIRLFKMHGQEHHIIPLEEGIGYEPVLDDIGNDMATDCGEYFPSYNTIVLNSNEKRTNEINGESLLVGLRLEMMHERNVAVDTMRRAHELATRDLENAHHIEKLGDKMAIEHLNDKCAKLEAQVKELKAKIFG